MGRIPGAGSHPRAVNIRDGVQDAWNLDLERLKDCCIHVMTRDSRLVPFCAFYLTGVGQRSLYRGD